MTIFYLRANLWYVAMKIKPDLEVACVPPIQELTKDQKEEGEKRYWKQKNARAQRKKTDESNDVSCSNLLSILTE